MLLRKLIQVIPVMLIVTFGTTYLMSVIPGSLALVVLGPYATQFAIKNFNHLHGFDLPLLDRYWHWLTALLAHGSFGSSIITGVSVLKTIQQAIPVTGEIAVFSMVIALVVSILLSNFSALHAGGTVDRIITAATSGLYSVPTFVLMVPLLYFLAVRTRVFPPNGWVPISSSLGENLRHIALPVMTLLGGLIPLFTRVLRGDIVSLLQEDFVLTARARGLPTRYIVFRHVFRPASISLITISGLAFGSLFGGVVVVESYFALPGLGNLIANSVTDKDSPIVLGLVVLASFVYLIINIGVDILTAAVDPRIRVGIGRSSE